MEKQRFTPEPFKLSTLPTENVDNTLIEGQEIVIFDAAVENRQRHNDNLSRLHGQYYKGQYYHQGRPQPHKK